MLPPVSPQALDPAYFEAIFAEFPASLALFNERKFYGKSLQLQTLAEANNQSRYQINLHNETNTFQSAIIDLNTRGARISAAAAHELLHLRQPIKGFPRVRSLSLNALHGRQISLITVSLDTIVNLLDHDIFVTDFVTLGYPIGSFIMPSATKVGLHEREAKRFLKVHRTTPQVFLWPFYVWWSIEYFRHVISIEHGVQEAQKIANNVLIWGNRALPDFDDLAKKIRAWIALGKHRDPKSYVSAVQDFLALVQMPRASSFAMIKSAVGDSFPTVEAVSA
jgi:hypothetical protein